MKSLCVYCGSRFGDDPVFRAAAEEIGRRAAEQGFRLVYGGGRLGLMGATARAAHQANGKVYGVIPEFLVDVEGVLEDVEHTIVKTMHERKMIMFEESDAILTLPGGIGTLEEVIETLSWARLALHRKPIIILNLKDFWTPLQELFGHIVDRDFAARELHDEVTFVDSVDAVFQTLNTRLLAGVV